MATSTKKLEKPVTAISPSFLKSFCTGTRCSVHFLEKKCEHMTASEITAPVAVASPAPNTPRSSTNTQNQSPSTLKMPPVSTAAVARPRSCVVSQEACHKLPQQEHREHAADRRKIRLRQRQKRFVRAEKQQDLALKKKNPSPRQHGENAGADDGSGKILVVFALRMTASTAGTEQNTPADAGQKPQ